MASGREMEVNEVAWRVVVPTTATDRHVEWLSNMDQVMPRYSAMCTYYYAGPDAASMVDLDRLATSLSHALTLYPILAGRLRTKSNGRLEVDCNDAGALLVLAVADGRLDDPGVSYYNPMSLPGDLRWTPPDESSVTGEGGGPHHITEDDGFLLWVKATSFRCGGVCVLQGVHHALADGLAAAQFMNAWATIVRLGIDSTAIQNLHSLLKCPPVHDRSLLKPRVPPSVRCPPKGLVFQRTAPPAPAPPPPPPSNAGNARSKVGLEKKSESEAPAREVSIPMGLPDMSVHLWHFTEEDLATLRRTANEDLKATPFEGCHTGDPSGTSFEEERSSMEATTKRFTANDVLTAHLWKCISRARGVHIVAAEEEEGPQTDDGSPSQSKTDSSEKTKQIRVGMAADGRKRLRPCLPEGYFGNVNFYACTSAASASDLVSESLGRTAQRVHSAVEEMTDEYLRDTIDWIDGQDDLAAIVPSFNNFLGDDVAFTNWSHFPFFECDFGWGPPVFAGIPPARFDGLVFVTATENRQASDYRGGLFVTLGLRTDHMDKLRSDPQFIKSHNFRQGCLRR